MHISLFGAFLLSVLLFFDCSSTAQANDPSSQLNCVSQILFFNQGKISTEGYSCKSLNGIQNSYAVDLFACGPIIIKQRYQPEPEIVSIDAPYVEYLNKRGIKAGLFTSYVAKRFKYINGDSVLTGKKANVDVAILLNELLNKNYLTDMDGLIGCYRSSK